MIRPYLDCQCPTCEAIRMEEAKQLRAYIDLQASKIWWDVLSEVSKDIMQEKCKKKKKVKKGGKD